MLRNKVLRVLAEPKGLHTSFDTLAVPCSQHQAKVQRLLTQVQSPLLDGFLVGCGVITTDWAPTGICREHAGQLRKNCAG